MTTTTLSHDHEPEFDGWCILRVDHVTPESDRLVWSFFVEEGEYRGSKVQYNTLLTPDHLWKLRILLESLEVKTLDGPFDFRPNGYLGRTIGGRVSDGQIVAFWPIEDENGEPVKLNTPAPAKDAEFTHRTKQEVDKAKADLDAALARYVAAKVSASEDIERWQRRSKAR